MYRWLAVLRFVLVANTVGLNVVRGGFAHPVGGAVLVAALVAWTCLISWVYRSYLRRTTFWLAADMLVLSGGVSAASAGLPRRMRHASSGACGHPTHGRRWTVSTHRNST